MGRLATLVLALLSLSVSAAIASDFSYGADHVVTLWSNSTAPHSNGIEAEESERRPNVLQNITTAQLLIFEAKEGRNGEGKSDQAVVICPGGGYSMLAIDREGYLMAQWFAEHGITAAVLKYRIPNGVEQVPIEDAVEGLKVMREQGQRFGFSTERVGIVGSSAGGMLAAIASTLPEDDEKPNFTVLFYPVISSEEGVGDKGSYDRLMGKVRTAEESERYSLDRQVSATTPPAIMFHSDDDKVVSPLNSTRYYTALKEHGVAASLHIYPTGGHGWGTNEVSFGEEWRASLLGWLASLGAENL